MWNWFCNYKAFIGFFFSWWLISLNELNRKKLWEKILSNGDKLQPLLKPSRYHPNGRNAYAHIALSIKEKFGQSYKDISDDKIDEIILHIEYLLKTPS